MPFDVNYSSELCRQCKQCGRFIQNDRGLLLLHGKHCEPLRLVYLWILPDVEGKPRGMFESDGNPYTLSYRKGHARLAVESMEKAVLAKLRGREKYTRLWMYEEIRRGSDVTRRAMPKGEVKIRMNANGELDMKAHTPHMEEEMDLKHEMRMALNG